MVTLTLTLKGNPGTIITPSTLSDCRVFFFRSLTGFKNNLDRQSELYHKMLWQLRHCCVTASVKRIRVFVGGQVIN